MTGRAPMGGVRLARWRRIDVRRLFTGDLPLKSAAIAVAILLWVAAMRALPPPEVTVAFEGRVPVERPEVPAGYVLTGALGDVAVTLRGPEAALGAIGQQQLRATLDIGAVVPGPSDQEAPVMVTVADDRVRVVAVEPASVAVRLERRLERMLPVQARFANEPPAGFQAGTLTFRPQAVAVSGPESLVAKVAAVFATVRFGDAPVDLAQDVRPIPADAAGDEVEGLDIDPVGVQVSVPVLSSATTRTVPVLAQTRGAVATGYWVSRLVTEPVVVTVSGERGAVEILARIDTAPIDVGGLTGGRTFTASLQVPEGVTVLGSSDVTITVTVTPLVGTRPFPLVAVRVNGLGPDLAAEATPGTVSVIVGGAVPVLDDLGPGSIVATVDATGRGPGTYTLPVAVAAPAGTTVESVQPQQVTVTIRSTSP